SSQSRPAPNLMSTYGLDKYGRTIAMRSCRMERMSITSWSKTAGVGGTGNMHQLREPRSSSEGQMLFLANMEEDVHRVSNGDSPLVHIFISSLGQDRLPALYLPHAHSMRT